jgi:hypothetical protein
VIGLGAIDAEAVAVPEWRSLLIKASRDIVLLADSMWLVHEHERHYLTACDEDQFNAQFNHDDRGGIEVPSHHAQVPATSALPIPKHFECDHLPEPLRVVSVRFRILAHDLAREIPVGPELKAGLRKLLEAKDCAVRAARGDD